MSDRKIYSHDDFINLTTKAIKAINDKDIILLTDEEFNNEDRCMAIYLSGKNKVNVAMPPHTLVQNSVLNTKTKVEIS